jgi:hypothetical protein
MMIAIIMITTMDITTGTITKSIITITNDSTTTIAKVRAIGMRIITTLSENTRAAIGTANGNRTFTKDSFLRLKCAEAFGLSRTIYSFVSDPRLRDTSTLSSAITFA